VRGKAAHLDGETPEVFVATLAGAGNSALLLQEMFVGTHGAWEFDDLPDGDYKIGILADEGSGRAVFSTALDREGINVELVKGGSLRGQVVSGLDGSARFTARRQHRIRHDHTHQGRLHHDRRVPGVDRGWRHRLRVDVAAARNLALRLRVCRRERRGRRTGVRRSAGR
jgi:hypothetical protein